MRRTQTMTMAGGMWSASVATALACGLLLANPAPAWTQEVAAAAATPPPPTQEAQQSGDDHGSGSRISDLYVPLQLDGFPNRPKPLLELGTPFLGTGAIGGFTIPGGAVWTPSFLMFGTFRTGLSTTTSPNAQGDDITTTQWANRFDLFGNLSFSFTERLVFGLRPIDETDLTGARRFTGYSETTGGSFNSPGEFNEYFNFGWPTVSHLFFEGDFGEMFPALDRDDSSGLDYGLAVGRQPISFQEGTLINDTLDAVGITRNNLRVGGLISFRITGVYAWNQLNRNTPSGEALLRNREAEESSLVGVFTEFDTKPMTVAIDGIYVRGGQFANEDGARARAGDGIYAGVSFVGRPGGGTTNLALRVLTSLPVGDETQAGALDISDPASRGSLVLAEYSWTPHHSHNFFYANGFAAIEDYRAAALDPLVSGPLARVGILFAGSGLGSSAPLSPTASDAVGGAFGHQRFFGNTRKQVLFEAAGRYSMRECAELESGCDSHAVGAGVRFQVAAGRRWVFIVDGAVTGESLRGATSVLFGKTWRLRRTLRFEFVTHL